ncbi:MAG: aldehyde dehydrogenase family protein [Alphaproteobacteria bacterium]|nr:aldehyde dehydrogenase family protein [Alphaproteobacteria bacterium]
MPSPKFPEPPSSIPPTPIDELDRVVDKLYEAAPRWVALGRDERVRLLRSAMDGMLAVSDRWVAATCKAKGHAPGSPGEGEEWLAGIMPVIKNLRQYAEALLAGGAPRIPRLRQRNGQWIAEVFPGNLKDRALFTGFSAEVRVMPGQEPTQGRVYREARGEGGVGLVLGAGNQASIGPMDLLYKLIVDDEVVVLKMNPVNEYLGPFIREAFRGFVDAGFLEVVYGGVEQGAHLCQHPKVASVHITGSNRSHDAIVWGSDFSQHEARKAADDRHLKKPISSELGAVTPILVVPGAWSESDMDYQARHVAAMVVQNASFNCNAGKVLVVAGDWDRRDAFIQRVSEVLGRQPARKAYYPGAQDRYEGFLNAYGDSHEVVGERRDEAVPWTLIKEVDADGEEYALKNEAFCGVLAVVDLPVADAAAYLAQAIPFVNDHVWGSLSATMIIDGRTQREHREAFEAALDALRYGGIGVNAWSGIVYGLVTPTWGAYPGHPLEDIRSGRGVVHNTYLIDHPEKSIVRAPFKIFPTPAWFADNKQLINIGKAMCQYEARPGWGRVLPLAGAAMRG